MCCNSMGLSKFKRVCLSLREGLLKVELGPPSQERRCGFELASG